MILPQPKEWYIEMAFREGDLEVGAGPRHDYLTHEAIEALLRCPLCGEQIRRAVKRLLDKEAGA